MEKLSSKFNLYDHIGYFLVGNIGLLVGAFNFHILNNASLILPLTTENLIIWILTSYFLGHVFQAIANIFIKEDKTSFSDSEKEILEKAKSVFKLKRQSDNEIYLICYMLASAKDITGQVQSFNAYYSMYRGWFIIFFLESVFLLFISISFANQIWYFASLATSIVFTILFFLRSKRFYQYSRSKTLQTFLLLRTIIKD